MREKKKSQRWGYRNKEGRSWGVWRSQEFDWLCFTWATTGEFHGEAYYDLKMKSETDSYSVLSESLWPHGLLQARILEWVAIPFSMDLCNPGIKPRSPTLQVDASPAEPPGKPTMIWPKRPRGIGWRGKGGGSGWGTHVNPWLIHVNVWQNHHNIVK